MLNDLVVYMFFQNECSRCFLILFFFTIFLSSIKQIGYYYTDFVSEDDKINPIILSVILFEIHWFSYRNICEDILDRKSTRLNSSHRP